MLSVTKTFIVTLDVDSFAVVVYQVLLNMNAAAISVRGGSVLIKPPEKQDRGENETLLMFWGHLLRPGFFQPDEEWYPGPEPEPEFNENNAAWSFIVTHVTPRSDSSQRLLVRAKCSQPLVQDVFLQVLAGIEQVLGPRWEPWREDDRTQVEGGRQDRLQKLMEAHLERAAERIRWTGQSTIRFLLDTSAVLCAQWLEAHTRDVLGLKFPAGRGYYQLDRGRAEPYAWLDYTGPIVVTLAATHCIEEDNVMHVGFGAGEAGITFSILPLAASRIEVQAQCHVPEVHSYFGRKLHEIGMAYPESGLTVKPEQGTQAAQIDPVGYPVTKKEQRRGGPVPTPEEDKIQIVLGWLEAQRKGYSQREYCQRKSIGVSTLGDWMRDLRARGKFPKLPDS